MTHRFFSSQAQGFVRCGVATPRAFVADPAANAAAILELARRGDAQGADLIVFPELCVSAYAIDDLHLQDALLDAVEAALAEICEASKGLACVLAVGAPVRRNGRLYNCAIAISRGRILGVTPKS
ncbi:MAG TPA: nitrilase-related carbon-nitrogen hydrolase, partial [Phenylobacterium sp.]|nr:nitrilase-related carbon-nitrogen hydrolase [Phenylobacterium sp.]